MMSLAIGRSCHEALSKMISTGLRRDDLVPVLGVLSLRKKTVKEAMTWLPDVYMLDKDRKTDAELLLDVHKHGYSRIPVYANEKSVNNPFFDAH